jgi:hypothetical protein
LELEGSRGLPWSLFFLQKVSITLERMQVFFILSQAIVIDLAISWLSPLKDTPPITTTDLLQAIDFWHINLTDLPRAVGYGREEIFIATLSQLDFFFFFFPSFFSFVCFPYLLCALQEFATNIIIYCVFF